MRFQVTPAVAALVLLVFAAGARAGAKPHIEKLEPEKGALAGSVIKIVGTNFTDTLADVKVTVAGQSCVVLEAKAGEILTTMPTSLKKGKHTLEVEIAKERSNQVQVEILGEEDRKRIAEEQRVNVEGQQAQVTKYLVLDVPQAIQQRGTLEILAPGKADYPDGTIIQLELKLDSNSIAQAEAEVEGKTFRGSFAPERLLFAGNYYVEAFFQLSNQPAAVRLAFAETVKDKKTAAEMKQAHDRQAVRVGTVQDEQFQLRELKMHFETSIARVRELLRDLEVNYMSAGRSMFRVQGGKVNEEEWEAWLDKWSLKGVAGEEKDKRIADARGAQKFLNKDGSFNDQQWREWIDFKWREEGLLKLLADHASYRDRYSVMKNQDDILRLQELFTTLLRLSYRRSTELYRGNGLPISEKDVTIKGKDGAVIGIGTSAAAASAAAVEGLARKIAKSVGLEETLAPEKK